MKLDDNTSTMGVIGIVLFMIGWIVSFIFTFVYISLTIFDPEKISHTHKYISLFTFIFSSIGWFHFGQGWIREEIKNKERRINRSIRKNYEKLESYIQIAQQITKQNSTEIINDCIKSIRERENLHEDDTSQTPKE